MTETRKTIATTISENKKTEVIKFFEKNLDQRHSHYTLLISTCYFNSNICKRLLNEVAGKFKIRKTIVMIDEREIRRIGIKKLLAWQDNINNEKSSNQVEIWAPSVSQLFHVKSYCLVGSEFSGFGFDEIHASDVRQGALCVGSANLTTPGLGENRGNYETLYFDTDVKTLVKHINGIYCHIGTQYLEDIEEKGFNYDTNFKFAVINEGMFAYKADKKIEQYFAVKVKLNQEGTKLLKNPEFEEMGYSTDAASLSKRYYKTDTREPKTERLLGKRIGIETFIGLWVPKGHYAEGKEEFGEFISDICKEIIEQKDRIMIDIERDFHRFIELGVAERATLEAEKNRFKSNCNELLRFRDHYFENRDEEDGNGESFDRLRWLLERIYDGWTFFDLPYDIKEDDHIDEVYEDLIEKSRASKRRNKSMKAILQADEQRSLSPLIQLNRELRKEPPL